jgi:hypothetical protein
MTTLVKTNNPQNLNDAITIAKRVEEGSEITIDKMSGNIN